MNKAEELQAARDRYAALGARNTYGLTADERIELDREYDRAKRTLLGLLGDGWEQTKKAMLLADLAAVRADEFQKRRDHEAQ